MKLSELNGLLPEKKYGNYTSVNKEIHNEGFNEAIDSLSSKDLLDYVEIDEDFIAHEIRMSTSTSGEFFGGMFLERLKQSLPVLLKGKEGR